MTIREASLDDLPEMLTLFETTIRSVNAVDYSQKEVDVWASGAQNSSGWSKKIELQNFFIWLKSKIKLLDLLPSIK